ncbi:MAG: hypothetical protein RI973_1051 [Bacteroidota bacterium]
MKILLAGQFKGWALEHHFVRYLSRHAEVFTYPAEEVFDAYYQSSVLNKVCYRLGLSSIQRRISRELLQQAAEVRPDVIWVFKGMRVTPQTLRQIRSRGIKLANYNPDHPFIFSSRGSGNSNVRKSIGLYDLHLCYSRSVQRRIEQEYGIRTAFLPFGFELSDSDYEAITAVTEINRGCFVGNPDKIRVEHLQTFAESGLPVDVYGHGWERHLAPSANVRIFDAVYGLEYWRTIRSYRLQLNIFRPHNEGSHNMRTFEVPAAGGIMLAPDSPEHQEFFTPEQEVFLYRSKDDMIDQARMLLSLPVAQTRLIREAARGRSVHSNYTYENRAAQAAEAFKAIL